MDERNGSVCLHPFSADGSAVDQAKNPAVLERRNNMSEEKEEQNDRLMKLEDEVALRARRVAEEFQAKVNRVRDQIRELQRQRNGIIRGKISRAETLEKFGEDLKKGRDNFVKSFLRGHLASYQRQTPTFQNLDHIRVHSMEGLTWFGFVLFSSITDQMVEAAVKELDEGPTQKDRETRIAELDKQINGLMKEAEGLLK